MRTRLLICLALAAAALAVPGATPAMAGSSSIKECGDLTRNGGGIYNLTTRVVSCRTAKRVSRRYLRECDVDRDCRVSIDTCRTRRLGDEYWDVRCTASRGRVVRFQFGA